MVNKNNKKKNSLAGRHSLESQNREDEKKEPNGLSKGQNKRLRNEALARGIASTQYLRQIVDWYFTAIDTKRGDIEANKMFDNVLEKSE